jgi:phosphocarrier protein
MTPHPEKGQTKGVAFSKAIVIVNERGLHARAAAKFVKLAETFKADIKLAKDGQEVNGRSIMDLLLLAGAQGSSVTLTVESLDGQDAEAAFAALEHLIEEGFGELDH